jgi:protein-S-isoprenylcysteine O-methyltransferase Ste14
VRLRSAVFGTIVFFFVAPSVVAGILPLSIAGARLPDAFPGRGFVMAAGALLISAGLAALSAAFAQFAVEGRGTPAPVAPTAKLVVRGLYRHVRNPMYVAVLAIILGQALVFVSVGVLAYAAAVLAAVHTFVVFYEEPTLRDTYGTQCETYVRSVPRWIPRIAPWRPAP